MRAFSFFLLLMPLVAFTSPQRSQASSIEGVVVASGTSQPVAGVRVLLIRVEGQAPIPPAAVTDGNGQPLVLGSLVETR